MQVGNDYNSLKLWDGYINFEISQKSTMKANEIFWQAIRLPIKNLMNLKLKYFLIYRINVVCRYRKFLDDRLPKEISEIIEALFGKGKFKTTPVISTHQFLFNQNF